MNPQNSTYAAKGRIDNNFTLQHTKNKSKENMKIMIKINFLNSEAIINLNY